MPLLVDPRPVEEVTEDIIRHHFNNSQILERLQAGNITIEIDFNKHKDPPPNGEPFCTRSQILYLYERNGDPIAVIHQYIRPDGSIGASGLPDPKRLFLPDRIMFVHSKPPEN